MPLTPEDSQKITNIQQQILRNMSAGKPISDGLTQEQVKEAIDLVRSQRAKALSAGTEKKGGKKKAASAQPTISASNLDALLKAKGVNLD